MAVQRPCRPSLYEGHSWQIIPISAPKSYVHLYYLVLVSVLSLSLTQLADVIILSLFVFAGISLPVDQWQKLKSYVDDIDEELSKF